MILVVIRVVGRELELNMIEPEPVALGSTKVEEEGYVDDVVDGSELASACAARLRKSND